MKKVAILTFHGAHNYGSVLQSYASAIVLSKLGYQTEIINLRNHAQIEAYKIFNTGSKIYNLFRLILYPQLAARKAKFEYFINKVLPISGKRYASGQEINVNELDYDIYYCGSDQIWNPACQDFESAYFLDFVKHMHPTIAYAPSLGKGDFTHTDKQLITSLLKGVDYLSCREESGCRIIEELSGRQAELVCDPVMLLTREEWAQIAIPPKSKKKYILAYFLNNNHGDRSKIEELQKRTGFRVILLNDYIKDFFKPGVKMRLNVSPQEFVGLIMNAEIVYTNSFHATAFSVIFNKEFYTAIAADGNVQNNNDSRKIDFLRSVGCEERLLRNGQPLCLNNNIDYKAVNKKVEEIRQHSLKYLKNALEGK